jgi:uncharacterized membrane protein YoaK (UPF0700 family)
VRLGGGSRRRWARITLAVEAVFLGASTVVAFAAPDATATVYALIAVTAFAMGLRNATVRRLGVPDLTTTVLTMTLTGLAADSRAAGGTGVHSPRRSASVAAMALGALMVGAFVVQVAVFDGQYAATPLILIVPLTLVAWARRGHNADLLRLVRRRA